MTVTLVRVSFRSTRRKSHQLPVNTRNCKAADCLNTIPEHKSGAARYCSDECRNRQKYNRKKKQRKSARKSGITPAVAKFRSLAKYANIEDPQALVREVLQDIVREQITQHVQDNILGAGEALTGLLPKAIAGLAADMESKDWVVRQRAQAAVLKYAMEFRDKTPKDEDLGTIQIVHNMAMPNTPLGKAVETEYIEAKELQIAAESGVEAFEQGWPKCTSCGERKHPDAVYDTDHGPLCSSCRISRYYRYNKSRPQGDGFLDRDPEYGRPVPEDKEQ